MGASLGRLCVPRAFRGRSECDKDRTHVFPRCVLTPLSLAGLGLEMEPGVRWDLLSVSARGHPHRGRARPHAVELNPWWSGWSSSFRLSVCLPGSWHWDPCPREGQCWSRGSRGGSWLLSATDGGLTCLWSTACGDSCSCFSAPSRKQRQVQSPLSSAWSLRPASGAGQLCLCTLGGQASRSPAVHPADPPAGQGLVSLGRTPGLGHSVSGSEPLFPRAGLHVWILPFTLHRRSWHRSRPDHFSSLPPQVCVDLYCRQSLFAIFQLLSTENVSPCRCTFDVFVREGEHHTLLLCHLESICHHC